MREVLTDTTQDIVNYLYENVAAFLATTVIWVSYSIQFLLVCGLSSMNGVPNKPHLKNRWWGMSSATAVTQSQNNQYKKQALTMTLTSIGTSKLSKQSAVDLTDVLKNEAIDLPQAVSMTTHFKNVWCNQSCSDENFRSDQIEKSVRSWKEIPI